MLAALIVATACGGAAAPAGSSLSGTIDVGAPLSLTGPAAVFGLDEQAGMRLAAEEVNSTHFLGNATLNLKFDDHAFSQQQAVTVVKREIEQDNDSAIVGMTASALSLSVAPIAQSSKTPLIVVESGVSGIVESGNYIFRAGIASPSYQGLTANALKKAGVKTTDILIDQTNPLVVEDGTVISGLFKKAGIKVVNTYQYTPTTTDFTAIMTRVREDRPDSLGIFAIGKVNLTLISQARQQGYTGRLYGLNSFSVVVGSGLESQCEGCLYATGYSPDMKHPSTQKFVAAYQAKAGKAPTSYVAEGYDSVWLLARGLKAAGSTDRAKVRDGIDQASKQGFAGAQGPLTFSNRDVRGPGVLIMIQNGKDVLQQ